MDRTSQWVFSQEIPTDVVITVGASEFPLHKFLLVAKSGLIRRKVIESDHPDLGRIDLSAVPGGPETFELAAKFCYGVNFEISARNVAALRCAAEFLEMTDLFSPSNLASRADDFLSRAALNSLPSALQVLRSCDPLLPLADHLRIVHRCVDAIGFKACVEANFPSRSPPEWWAAELAAVGPVFCRKILDAMRNRGASPKKLSTAVAVYIEKSLPGLVPLAGATVDLTGEAQTRRRGLLESITAILLPEKDAPLPVGFLCCLLQAAIFLDCSAACRRELEKRISASLDQAAVRDLLTVALDHRGERVADLDSVRRIVAGFVEREMEGGGAFYGGGGACCSVAAQKVARTVDAFVGEVATDEDVPVSKFAGVAGAVPKSCRRFDDDLYRAIDIYLKAHPGLDEIEREKVCSVMDPLKLSYEARLHASQNKRLPLQIVLGALYYDQLKLRSGEAEEATSVRGQATDATLMRENEELRSELTRMKMHMTDMQRGRQGSSTSATKVAAPRKAFMSSVTKTLGRLNPFGRHGWSKDTSTSIDMRRRGRAKDTSSIEDVAAPVDVSKPRRRRFSLS